MLRAARGGSAAGALWSAVNAGAAVLLPLLIFVVFAHLVAPAQIGAVALAVACAEFVKAFGLPGAYEALLQQGGNEAGDRERLHETTLALLLLAGAVLLPVYAGVLAAVALATGGLATTALLAIGLRVPLDLATLQPQAALAQRLSYRRMAVRSIVANLAAGAIGLAIAFAGRPLDGLIAYQLGQSALLFATTVLGTGALARPRLHRDCLRRLRREAGLASIVRLVAATNAYVDQILIAAMLDTLRLAWFNLAKRAETTFITTASAFSSILFQPLFATRQGRARGPVLGKGLAMLTLLCGLPAIFTAVNHTALVGLVFGRTWLPAAPAVALLAISGLLRALGSVHGALLSVSGRNAALAALSSVSALAGIATVLLTAPHGVVWCAAGLALKNLAVTGGLAASTRRDAPELPRLYLRDVLLPLTVMTGAAIAGRSLGTALLPGSSMLSAFAGMTVSLLFAAGAGLVGFAPRLLRPTPVPAVAAR